MLLSIIIPAYNVSEYIDKCLTSILDCNIKMIMIMKLLLLMMALQMTLYPK